MSEPPTFLAPLILLVPVTVLIVLSRYSGWNRLAEHYPADRDFPRPAKWMGYGVFRRWLGYNGGIIVASDASGLYLRTWPIVMSFCHRRIYIPWSEITEIEKLSTWSGAVVAIRTRRARDVDFALRPSTFAVVRDHARGAGVPGEY